MPILGTFEDDFDQDGFASDDVVQFELRKRVFTCRRLTSAQRDQWFQDLSIIGTEGKFFESVLIEEDVEPFMAMANDPDNPVRKATIEALLEQVGTRVLGIQADPKSSGSSGGSKQKGRKRTGG